MKKFAAALFIIIFSAFISLSVYAQDINVCLNRRDMSFSSQEPVISNGRTLVPLRGLFDNMGYSIDWNSITKTVTLSGNSVNTIKITIGAESYTVEGESFKLDTPAQIINGSAMIPLRAVAEATGAAVYWDVDSKTIYIYTALSPNILTQSSETKFIGSALIKDPYSVDTYLLVESTDILTRNEEEYLPLADVMAAIGNTSYSYSGNTFNMKITDFGVLPNIEVSLNTESGDFTYKQYMTGYEKNAVKKSGNLSFVVENGKVYIKADDILNIFGWWYSLYFNNYDLESMTEYLDQHSDTSLVLPYSCYNIDLSAVNHIDNKVIVAISCGD